MKNLKLFFGLSLILLMSSCSIKAYSEKEINGGVVSRDEIGFGESNTTKETTFEELHKELSSFNTRDMYFKSLEEYTDEDKASAMKLAGLICEKSSKYESVLELQEGYKSSTIQGQIFFAGVMQHCPNEEFYFFVKAKPADPVVGRLIIASISSDGKPLSADKIKRDPNGSRFVFD
jgi:hypothetical protein